MVKKLGKKKKLREKTDPSVSMKTYITLIQKQATEELKHHTAALAEHMEERIIGIGEEFVDFRRILNSHTEMIGALAEDVSGIRTDVNFLKDDVAVLKDDMIIVKKDISIMKEDIFVLKEDVAEIKDDLKQKVDRGEFVVLEHRVGAVEAKI